METLLIYLQVLIKLEIDKLSFDYLVLRVKMSFRGLLLLYLMSLGWKNVTWIVSVVPKLEGMKAELLTGC